MLLHMGQEGLDTAKDRRPFPLGAAEDTAESRFHGVRQCIFQLYMALEEEFPAIGDAIGPVHAGINALFASSVSGHAAFEVTA